MNDYFAYIRVSTAKQGEGVSLQEQRDAIVRHAEQNHIRVVEWFEEKETAAKRGRSVFGGMMKNLRKGAAKGVVIHKIDRSARNLRDWADLGELLDQGVDVRFANEGLDLTSRGGRLSADIQAVVAADYIRNLREETLKGIYGRLKQGIYPLPAPVGYLDMGAGKPKEPDPIKGPLVCKAFELYATGEYSIRSLSQKMHELGLTNRAGGRISKNGWSTLLNNPFYIGLIRLKKSGQVFEGAHVPLIKKAVFDRAQAVLEGKYAPRTSQHDYLLRRRLQCRICHYSLVGERQKGRVYYRCHQVDCPTTSIREDRAESEIVLSFHPLTLSEEESDYARKRVSKLVREWDDERMGLVKSSELSLKKTDERLNRLTDGYLDGVLDRALFEQRKKALFLEKKSLEERTRELSDEKGSLPAKVAEYLELAKTAQNAYKLGLPEEKRDLLSKVTSNRFVESRNLTVVLSQPFDLIANRAKVMGGTPSRDVPRTMDRLISQLFGFVQKRAAQNPTP